MRKIAKFCKRKKTDEMQKKIFSFYFVKILDYWIIFRCYALLEIISVTFRFFFFFCQIIVFVWLIGYLICCIIVQLVLCPHPYWNRKPLRNVFETHPHSPYALPYNKTTTTTTTTTTTHNIQLLLNKRTTIIVITTTNQ